MNFGAKSRNWDFAPSFCSDFCVEENTAANLQAVLLFIGSIQIAQTPLREYIHHLFYGFQIRIGWIVGIVMGKA